MYMETTKASSVVAKPKTGQRDGKRMAGYSVGNGYKN